MILNILKIAIFIIQFLLILTNLVYAEHGHATTDPIKLIDVELTRNVVAHNSAETDAELDETFKTCTAKEFISGLNCSQYLPDDYEQVKNEEIKVFVPSINDTVAVLDRLRKWGQKLMNDKDLGDSAKLISSHLFELLYEANLNPECLAAFLKIVTNIQNGKLWALKFFDSFGNIMPSGLAAGRIASLGEYDECIKIISDPDNGTLLFGQYCQLHVNLPYPSLETYQIENEMFLSEEYMPGFEMLAMQLEAHIVLKNKPVLKLIEGLQLTKGNVYKLGICIPHVCQPIDIESALNKLLYPVTKIPVAVPDITCSSKVKTIPLDKYQKVAIMIISILIALVIISTMYEIFKIYFPKSVKFYHPNDATITEYKTNVEKIALSFSVITNTKKLLEAPQFPAIYSLRLIITFIHFLIMSYIYNLVNTSQRYMSNSFPMHAIHANRYFFVRSPILWLDAMTCCLGLLLSYNILGKLRKTKSNFNYGSFVWQRWVRVAIPLAGSILLIYLAPRFGDGPVWNQQWLFFQPACRTTVNLLGTLFSYNNFMFYINNYQLVLGCPLCNTISWYFSAMFQLYIFTPILLLSLHKWPKFGVSLNIWFVIIGTIATLWPKLLYGYDNFNDFKKFDSMQTFMKHTANFFISPFQYIASLSLGIFIGYILRNHPNINLGGKAVELIIWIIAISIIPLTYVWNNTFWSLTETPSQISILIWYSLGRTLWTSAFGWFYFACSTGRGGIISRFLSIRALQPIAKLYYTIYILQAIVIWNRVYSVRDAYIMIDWKIFGNIYVDMTALTIFAYLFYIILERPLINLIDLLSSTDNWSEYDNSEMYGINLSHQKDSIDKKCIENGENNTIVANDLSENSSINTSNNNASIMK